MGQPANPYRAAPGSEPAVLAGRDVELAHASHAIELTAAGGAARPIVVTGLRGMGKTALLRRFVHSASEGGGIVVQVEATPRAALAGKLRDALEEARRNIDPLGSRIRDAFDATIAALPKTSLDLPDHLGSVTLGSRSRERVDEGLVPTLQRLNIALRRSGRFLVLAVDEIQHGDPATLELLIELVHRTAGTDEPILFVGAGLRNSEPHLKKIRTYTERWRFLEIGLLSHADTLRAIEEPARMRQTSIDPSGLDRLASGSRGYPFFLQELASAAWARHDRISARITTADVEATLPIVLAAFARDFYEEPLRRLTPRETTYVLAMAELDQVEPASADVAAALGSRTERVSSIRTQLIRKDIVYSPSDGFVAFRMPFMGDHLRREAARYRVLAEARAARRRAGGIGDET